MEIKNLTLQSTPHNFPFRLYLINTIFPLQIIPIFLVITTLFSFNPSSHSSPFLGVMLRCSIPPLPPLSHQHFHTLSSQISHSSPFIGDLLRCSIPPLLPSHSNISTPYRLKSAAHRHLLAFCYAVASLIYPIPTQQHFHALAPFSTIVYPCCSLPPSQFSRRSSCHIMAALIYISH